MRSPRGTSRSGAALRLANAVQYRDTPFSRRREWCPTLRKKSLISRERGPATAVDYESASGGSHGRVENRDAARAKGDGEGSRKRGRSTANRALCRSRAGRGAAGAHSLNGRG